jgi:hypothetical protein
VGAGKFANGHGPAPAELFDISSPGASPDPSHSISLVAAIAAADLCKIAHYLRNDRDGTVPLAEVATVKLARGPAAIRTEHGLSPLERACLPPSSVFGLGFEEVAATIARLPRARAPRP